MTINALKLGLAAAIALACIVALILDSAGNKEWATPVLTAAVFYVIGNAQITSGEGVFSPVISKE